MPAKWISYMLIITNINEIPALPISLQPIIELVVSTAIAAGLQDQTAIIVIEDGDSEETVAQAIGWNPLRNPIDGIRYDDRDFVPYWSWLDRHDGWYRLIHTVGTNYAYELLIEASGDDPFHAMCKGA